MNKNFHKIHKYLLDRSEKLPFLRNQIKINKIISINDTELDFFFYFCKIIISQQISNNIAKILWKDFCNISKIDKLKFKIFPRKSNLLKTLEQAKISMKKKQYIENLYDLIIKKKISPEELFTLTDCKLKNKLISLNGVGPWTADMMLIFFFKRLNIFPIDDLVIKKVMLKIKEEESLKINFNSEFTPFLSILSLHFWKMSDRIL